MAQQFTAGTSLEEVGRLALTVPREGSAPPALHDLLLDGMASLFTGNHAAAMLILREAVTRLARGDVTGADVAAFYNFGVVVTNELWDDEAYGLWSHRAETVAREHGALIALQVMMLALAKHGPAPAASPSPTPTTTRPSRSPAPSAATSPSTSCSESTSTPGAASRTTRAARQRAGRGSHRHRLGRGGGHRTARPRHPRARREPLRRRARRSATAGGRRTTGLDRPGPAPRHRSRDAHWRAHARRAVRPRTPPAGHRGRHSLGNRAEHPVPRPHRPRRRGRGLLPRAISQLERTSVAVDLAHSHLLYGEWLRVKSTPRRTGPARRPPTTRSRRWAPTRSPAGPASSCRDR